MKQDDLISLLDRSNFLFMREISEPEENSLRLVVEEAIVDSWATTPVDIPRRFSGLQKGASPIRSTDSCKVFELRWHRYIAYLVTEEMAGSAGSYKEEKFIGNLFRTYTRSHFLDHLSRDTGGHAEPIVHHKVVCQNHLIDVASYDQPIVTLLPRT